MTHTHGDPSLECTIPDCRFPKARYLCGRRSPDWHAAVAGGVCILPQSHRGHTPCEDEYGSMFEEADPRSQEAVDSQGTCATDQAAAILDEIKGRWSAREQHSLGFDPVDASRLLAAVEAALGEHRQIPDQRGVADGPPRVPICSGCWVAWPCQEYQVITTALTGRGGREGDG
jgi:hypothetical protein